MARIQRRVSDRGDVHDTWSRIIGSRGPRWRIRLEQQDRGCCGDTISPGEQLTGSSLHDVESRGSLYLQGLVVVGSWATRRGASNIQDFADGVSHACHTSRYTGFHPPGCQPFSWFSDCESGTPSTFPALSVFRVPWHANRICQRCRLCLLIPLPFSRPFLSSILPFDSSIPFSPSLSPASLSPFYPFLCLLLATPLIRLAEESEE